MPDIKTTRVGNEFRSIRTVPRIVAEVGREVARRAVETAELVADTVEPYLPQDPRRRKILKYSLFGGGMFVLGKVLGPSISLFPGELDINGDKEYLFKNFRVVENSRGLAFFDKLGNEILLLEKEEEKN